MKTLTFNGISLDVNKELKIYSGYNKSPFGFKVTIKYSMDGKFKILPHNTETFNNVTSVINKNQRIIIKSEIHYDSYTYNFNDIEELTIEPTEILENNF